jgi:hypothetical protein
MKVNGLQSKDLGACQVDGSVKEEEEEEKKREKKESETIKGWDRDTSVAVTSQSLAASLNARFLYIARGRDYIYSPFLAVGIQSIGN